MATSRRQPASACPTRPHIELTDSSSQTVLVHPLQPTPRRLCAGSPPVAERRGAAPARWSADRVAAHRGEEQVLRSSGRPWPGDHARHMHRGPERPDREFSDDSGVKPGRSSAGFEARGRTATVRRSTVRERKRGRLARGPGRRSPEASRTSRSAWIFSAPRSTRNVDGAIRRVDSAGRAGKRLGCAHMRAGTRRRGRPRQIGTPPAKTGHQQADEATCAAPTTRPCRREVASECVVTKPCGHGIPNRPTLMFFRQQTDVDCFSSRPQRECGPPTPAIARPSSGDTTRSPSGTRSSGGKRNRLVRLQSRLRLPHG